MCRFFGELGAQCESVVGVSAAPRHAASFEPHLVVAESALLSPTVLDSWSNDDALHDIPVLAVSLTHRSDECPSVNMSGLAGVVYLPSLDRAAAATLLQSVWRQRGVDVPFGTFVSARPAAAAQL
ncbi:MAG: hypothetical protein ABI969_15325 [bacterium]